MLGEGVDRETHGDRALRPGREPTVETDPGEYGDRLAVREPEALDRVEAVEIDPSLAEIRQVPAGRWSTTLPPAPIEDVVALQDPADRSQRRDRPWDMGLLEEGRADRPSAILAEDARLAQLPAEAEDHLFNGRIDPARTVERVRAVAPVDPIEAGLSGPGEPALDGRQPDAVRSAPRRAGDAPYT